MLLIVLLAVASIVTLWLIARSLRDGQLTWDVGASFIFVLGWAKLLSIVYGKLSGNLSVSRDNRGQLTFSPVGLSAQVEQLILFGVLGLSLFLIVHASYKKPDLRLTSYFGIAVIATSLVVMLSDPSAYRNVFTGNPMILLIVLVAAAFAIPTRRGVLTGGAVFVLSVCSLGAFIGLLDRSKVFMECRTDKCAITGDFYMAATSHGNTLGMIAAVGIPFIWLAFRGATRLWMLAYVVANLVLSGSRTSMVAGAIVLLALLLTRPTRDAGTDLVRGRRSAVLMNAVVIASVVAAILPLTGQGDTFATGRGYLWRIAFEQFEDTPFLGAGLTAWDQLLQRGEIGAAAAYSTHNQWVEVLFLGGIVALLIWTIGYVVLVTCGDDSLRFTALPVLLALAVLGATERPMSIGLVNSMTWTLVALIGLSTFSRSRTSSTDPTSPAASTPTRARTPVATRG